MKLSDIHLTLVKVRKERELAQQDIADALNVEQATISLYENGKRGIPLDILDDWLQMLEIEVTITPKECEPVKPANEVQAALEQFNTLKKRRNYLIAEMRAQMAEKLLAMPEFQQIKEETGEPAFWPYSFRANEKVGLVETRYDHPEQKFLAVEYTGDEVNVYKFLNADEVSDWEGDREWLKINRIYFSEDDFLTFGGLWDPDSFDLRRITILRKNKNHPDGVEIIDSEGFPIRALLDMQETHLRFSQVLYELEKNEAYTAMENELDVVGDAMLNIMINNRLKNGAADPVFEFWNEADLSIVDVPLGEPSRTWSWVEEGVAWEERLSETVDAHIENTEDVNIPTSLPKGL